MLSGTVRSTDGAALSGASVDVWQSDARGAYSHFNYPEPRYNLRGRLSTDTKGRFEVRTVIPSPYEIPKQGPTGSLLNMMGVTRFAQPTTTHDGPRWPKRDDTALLCATRGSIPMWSAQPAGNRAGTP
jgi:catechol 1,2-dioxygenase